MTTVPELLDLMKEIEAEDPIDFADLPFEEGPLRELVLTSLLEREAQLQADAGDSDQRVLIYMLSTAKLVLENLVLHARLLRLQGQTPSVEDVLKKFRRS